MRVIIRNTMQNINYKSKYIVFVFVEVSMPRILVFIDL